MPKKIKRASTKKTAKSARSGKPTTSRKPATAKRRTARKAAVSEQNVENVPRMKIRVIGIGGGGGNIVKEIAKRLPRADFVAANTDVQALRDVPRGKVKTFAFGQEYTRGLGAGMDAEIGSTAAKAEKERIKKLFEGQDVCILVSSLGGGTGSGAVPVFAQAANEEKCLTIGIFTLPFHFEGEKRQQTAKTALEQTRGLLNTHIVIPNENIFGFIEQNAPLRESLSAVNRQLADTLEGLLETISLPGLINIDFADLRSVLDGRGRLAFLNSALVGGPSKAQEVAQQVVFSPLSNYGIEGTERMLFNIAADRTLKMHEVAEISSGISAANPKARIIFGISHQPKLKGKLRVTLFAVGCKDPRGGKRDEKKHDKKPKEQEVATVTPPANEAPVQEKVKTKPKRKKRSAPAKKAAVQTSAAPAVQRTAGPPSQLTGSEKLRRNGLDIKKAVDRELQELEDEEKKWEIPSFLRNRSTTS